MRTLAVCCAAAALAGCGNAHEQQQPAPLTGREWRANAVVIVRQLQGDIAATQIVGGTAASGRAALHNVSSLYGLLVSYSDFGGCRQMVAAAGAAPPTALPVERLLATGCRHLERASTLYTRAVTRNDGGSLVAAGRESGRALPTLVRAAALLGGRR